MKKFTKIKNAVSILTVILVILDCIISNIIKVYHGSLTAIILLSYMVNSLIDEYAKHKLGTGKVSKTICIMCIILSGLSLYWIIYNFIS